MAALGGAVALEEVDHVAVAVGEHLHLDVATGLDVLLHEHGVVAEGSLRLASRGGEGLGVLVGSAHDAHALAATAGGGLDQDREVEGRGIRLHVVRRDHGDSRFHRDLAGRVLAAHLLHHAGARTDQRDAGVLHGLREGGALGEEAVAGVDRVGSRRLRGTDDRLDVEVGADRHRLVGVVHVRRGAVDLAVQRDGVQAHGTRGPDDPAGDLATVGDQESIMSSWFTVLPTGCSAQARSHAAAHILKMP